MGDWRRALMVRQRISLALYGLVLLLLIGSLFMVFWADTKMDYVQSTAEVIWDLGSMVKEDPEWFRADSWADFVEGPISALSFGLSHLLVLPGGFMLFLATRSAVFVWSGGLIWGMLFLMGPVAMLLGDAYPPFQAGFWSWAGWTFLIALAHFLMAPGPRRVIPSGFPPSPERAPLA